MKTLIGAAILKSGHPYIWARYREPIIMYSKLNNVYRYIAELFIRKVIKNPPNSLAPSQKYFSNRTSYDKIVCTAEDGESADIEDI